MTKVLNTVSTIGALVMAATPLLAAGGFARAQDLTVTPQVIRVGDLDLGRPADRARFDRRVDAAADRMCGSTGLMIDNSCRQAVRDEAAEKLDARRADAAGQTAQAASFTVAGR